MDARAQLLSCVQLFVTPLFVACQAPLSMGFSRQEYWSGLPLPPSGDLPDPGMEPVSPSLAGRFFTTESPEKPYWWHFIAKKQGGEQWMEIYWEETSGVMRKVKRN